MSAFLMSVFLSIWTGLCRAPLHVAAFAALLMGSPVWAQAVPSVLSDPSPPVLRIGMEGANPPFNFLDEQGRLAGFELELGKALCARIRRTCEFIQRDWDGLRADLRAGRLDAVMSSVEITERRRMRLAFTAPYYRIPRFFMATRDRYRDGFRPQMAAQARLGAIAGSRDAEHLAEVYPDAPLQLYAKAEEAYLDLVSGRIDLVLSGALTFGRFLSSDPDKPCCVAVHEATHDPRYDGEGVGIALLHGRDALRRTFEEGLRDLRADGTWAALVRAHVPFPLR